MQNAPDRVPATWLHVEGPLNLNQLPSKYAEHLRANTKLHKCCRVPEHHECNLYRTKNIPEGLADAVISTCRECNRNHYFVRHGPQEAGHFEWYPEFLRCA